MLLLEWVRGVAMTAAAAAAAAAAGAAVLMVTAVAPAMLLRTIR
jgi:hypothetical protein